MFSPVHADSPSGKARELRLALFDCVCTQIGSGLVLLHLAGELDLATSSQFERMLDEAQKSAIAVTIDLDELTFIDSAGLAVIVNASHRAVRTGSKLALINSSGQVKRVLELTRVPNHVELHPVKASAPASFNGGPSAAASAG